MPVALRLVPIVLAAPIASHVLTAIVLFQPFLLFISVVSYPVTVAASTVLAYPVHRLIQANCLSAWRQLVAVVPLSLLGALSAMGALYLQTSASLNWLSYNAQLPHTRVDNGTLLLGALQLGPTEGDSVDAGTNAR